MGILGSRKIKKRTREVTVGFAEDGSEIKITLSPPRLEEMDAVDERIPRPQAPILKDEFNRPKPMLAPNGDPLTLNGSPVYERNTNDPAFKLKKRAFERAQTMALILSMTSDLKPETPAPAEGGDWLGYYLAVWQELEDAGLGVDAFTHLNQEAEILMAPMSKEEVESSRVTLGVDKASSDAAKEEMTAAGKKPPRGK